jgi:hypothetical protein
VVAENPGAQIRVERADGRTVTLYSVKVTEDSLTGREKILSSYWWCLVPGGCLLAFAHKSVRMPLADVRSTQVGKFERGRTIAALTPLVVLGVAMALGGLAGGLDYSR